MFGSLTRLFQSFNALADAVQGVAVTLREADAGLRARLGFESPGEPPALEAPAREAEPEPEAVSPSRKAKGVPRG